MSKEWGKWEKVQSTPCNRTTERMRVPGGWLVHVLQKVQSEHGVRFGIGNGMFGNYTQPSIFASSVVFVPDAKEPA